MADDEDRGDVDRVGHGVAYPIGGQPRDLVNTEFDQSFGLLRDARQR